MARGVCKTCQRGTATLSHREICLGLLPHERFDGHYYKKYHVSEDDVPVTVMRYVPMPIRSLHCAACGGRIMLMTDQTAIGLMQEYRCLDCARVPSALEPAPLSLVGTAHGEGYHLPKQAKYEYESQLLSGNGHKHTRAQR